MALFAVLWSHAAAALAPSCLGTVLGGVRRGPRRDRQAHPWHLNVHRRGCDPGRIRSLRFHATSSAAAVSRGSGRRPTRGQIPPLPCYVLRRGRLPRLGPPPHLRHRTRWQLPARTGAF
ncbi:hypothetical protein B296_00031993 [Ensete ventricosum]|uniref:Secreted protein n=1 Tax=Ensete ventricosum TaxID=4639 RepID=A0A426XKY3_ENSVE|nr:hypothetical protein B296_00031993 [Ensete ventricosum]